jgi:hypothetical protein
MTTQELMYFPSISSTSVEFTATADLSKSIMDNIFNTNPNAIGRIVHDNPSLDLVEPEIVKIEILVPNKVLRFTFKHGTQIKTVCNEEDAFDFDFAIYLAYSKLVNKDRCTKEGIEYRAHRMKYWKLWAKKVKEAKKLFKEQEAKRIKKEKEEKERAAARKRQAEKKARKKKERKKRELKALAEKIKNVN